jgi:hypothetical protein
MRPRVAPANPDVVIAMSLHNHAADDGSKRFSRAVGSRPALTFFARGDSGGERITFFSGGITGPYGDTASKPAITVDLTPGWKKYTINLNGADLRRVVGAFG